MYRNKLLSFILLLCTASACSDQPPDDARVVDVVRGSVEEFVTAQGKLEPRTYVDIGTQVTGQLKKLHCDFGSVVKAGDLLAEIDPRLYQARVDANLAIIKNLEAQRLEQQANLTLAKQRLDREVQLLKLNASSPQIVQEFTATLRGTQARIQSITAQIEQTQSTLSGDQANLGFTKIHAPINGVIMDLVAKEGQTLNANQTTPTILKLADLDTMTVRVQVAEADITRLSPSMEVYFSPIGTLDQRWSSTIRQILPSPEIVNEVVLYNVLVDVDNKDRRLLNGMSAQVFFVVGRAENVPLLPLEALGRRTTNPKKPEEALYQVKVWNGSRTEERVVTVGFNDRKVTEIRTGLREGERVLIERKETIKTQQNQRGGWRGGGARL